MTNDELKEALQSGRHVIYKHPDGRETEYKGVTAIIYRQRNGRIKVSAEIEDINAPSVIVCDPAKIRFKE